MTLKLNSLATAMAFAFATAAAAQTQPTTTTQTTTTQTPPTATETQPTTTQTQPDTCQCPPPTTTQTTTTQTQPPTTSQTTTETQQTTSEPGATDQPAAGQTGQVTKATAADIKAGASVYDETGAMVGKVDSVGADSAIVNTGKARADIPLSSFGKNDKGLVVSVTKTDLDAEAKKETKPKK